MKKQVIIKVLGMVQGVFFRAFVEEKAKELGLVGWVRNEEKGTVKIVAEGQEEPLKKLIDYCQQGSRFAKVDKVEVEWLQATGEFSDFEIRYN